MQFIALIEKISSTLTADNIETVVALVEKLVALAEAMKSSQAAPSATTTPAAPTTNQ